MNIFKWVKTYPKDAAAVAGVVILGLLAVSADGFSDLAHKKFWWVFWEVVGVASLAACVLGWVYLKNKDGDSKK